MNFIICPNVLEYAKNDMAGFGVSVLFNIIDTNNSKKICLDNHDYIYSKYEEVIKNDNTAVLLTFLNALTNKKNRKIISFNEEVSDLSFKEVVPILVKRIYTKRHFITIEVEEYRELISNYDINVLEPNDAIDFFNESIDKSFDYDILIKDILLAIEEMSTRQRGHRIEDLHNDILVSKLRNKLCYQVHEQVREGRSSGNNTGELDFIIKDNMGSRKSIVEALRSNSCDVNLGRHFNKLINRYDTLGLKLNFLVVYVENNNFKDYCIRYDNFMLNINNRDEFESDNYRQTLYISTCDELANDFTDIKLSKSIIERNGYEIEVMHIVVNFSSSMFIIEGEE